MKHIDVRIEHNIECGLATRSVLMALKEYLPLSDFTVTELPTPRGKERHCENCGKFNPDLLCEDITQCTNWKCWQPAASVAPAVESKHDYNPVVTPCPSCEKLKGEKVIYETRDKVLYENSKQKWMEECSNLRQVNEKLKVENLELKKALTFIAAQKEHDGNWAIEVAESALNQAKGEG